MYNVKAQTFTRDYEYDDAKRQARKAERERRNARKGKRVVWNEKE